MNSYRFCESGLNSFFSKSSLTRDDISSSSPWPDILAQTHPFSPFAAWIPRFGLQLLSEPCPPPSSHPLHISFPARPRLPEHSGGQTPRCAAVSAQRQQQYKQQQPKYSSSTGPTVTPQHPGSGRLLSGALLWFVDVEHIYEHRQRDLWSPWLLLCPFPMTVQGKPTASA